MFGIGHFKFGVRTPGGHTSLLPERKMGKNQTVSPYSLDKRPDAAGRDRFSPLPSHPGAPKDVGPNYFEFQI